jgi:flagellar basal-body rod protein FlgC
MKIGNNFAGFKISAKGLSIQRKKMNLIAENIANAENTRTETGDPYKRKFMIVSNETNQVYLNDTKMDNNLKLEVLEDEKEGEMIFLPSHPDADQKGYVQMSNVNVVQEMVEMIAASRSYEANLTALNASKDMAKDSLEI